MKRLVLTCAMSVLAGSALAGAHAMAPRIEAADQPASDGVVTADFVVAPKPGWLVLHRTADGMKPGPVVGHAPLRHGENTDVIALLTESLAPGDKLMLMIHAEDGGMETGIFEYSLGAKEDGPVRFDDRLVMNVVTVQ